ncbi:MAG: CRISPR-associated protein Cas4 [Clostridia bacterium]|nr:CRISPR-associated protein Cas4 [Clostridia bacterium]
MPKEDDYLALSGLQHFLFCRRQWALIHIENQWAENLRTTEGQLLHERAHDETLSELRGNVLIVRGLRVSSEKLGVSGQCDVVEFHRTKEGIPLHGREGLWTVYPVEYKRGEPKADRCDAAQLCAEAMCLEEMLKTAIPEGALFYGETRRRTAVAFDQALRSIVTDALREMNEMYRRGYTPKCKTGKWCNACSLKEICLPVLQKDRSVEAYIKEALCESC